MDYIKEVIKFFTPKAKNNTTINTNDSSFCTCKRTDPDYCDTILHFLNMTRTNKNFNPQKAKEIYIVK
jgi:hypothetical protein